MAAVHRMRAQEHLHCAGCGIAKSPQWPVLPPRNQSKGKGKGKGKSENENKGKGKGKEPSYRKPQLDGWVQVVKRGAATGQPAGQGPASAGAAQTNNEKRQAAQIAALQRQLAAKAAAPAAGAADVPVEDEDTAEWECPSCTASHRNGKKTSCRICDYSRTAASDPAAAPAVLSAEEVATKRAELVACKEALAVPGMLDPGAVASMVKQIDAKLRSLDKAPAEPEAKGPLARLNEAQEAADKANCYCLGLIEKAAGIKKRLNEVQLDWVAVGHAVKKAENALLQANAALAAAATATAAMAAPPPAAGRRGNGRAIGAPCYPHAAGLRGIHAEAHERLPQHGRRGAHAGSNGGGQGQSGELHAKPADKTGGERSAGHRGLSASGSAAAGPSGAAAARARSCASGCRKRRSPSRSTDFCQNGDGRSARPRHRHHREGGGCDSQQVARTRPAMWTPARPARRTAGSTKRRQGGPAAAADSAPAAQPACQAS